MTIDHLQNIINERADEKLLRAVRDKTGCIRQSAKAMLSQYHEAKIEARNPHFVVQLPVSNVVGGRIIVDDNFFDALEKAMFDSAVNAAREAEVRDFLRTIESSEIS